MDNDKFKLLPVQPAKGRVNQGATRYGELEHNKIKILHSSKNFKKL